MARRILKYPGSKWRLAEWIVSLMPPHKSYLEPFFGSGAVFFNKPPSKIETINDLDGEIVNLFRVARDMPEALERAVALTPYSREEYERAAAIKAACDAVWFGGGAPSVTAAINQIPAADVEPVRHGRWHNNTETLPDPAGFGLIPVHNVWRCSQCGWPVINETEDADRLFNYCPNCGAKMDQETEE